MNNLNPHTLSLPKALVTLVAGALFGFGLSLATMVQPDVGKQTRLLTRFDDANAGNELSP